MSDQKETPSQALEDFQSPQEVQEHVRELLTVNQGSLAAVKVHYQILVPGLFFARIPQAARAMREYGQQAGNAMPIQVSLPAPIIRLYPGHSDHHLDHQILVMTSETWDRFSDYLLGISFADRPNGLVVWPDIDAIRVVSQPAVPTSATLEVSAVVLRSNRGGWRLVPKNDHRPVAIFNPNDAGNYRMGQIANKIDL